MSTDTCGFLGAFFEFERADVDDFDWSDDCGSKYNAGLAYKKTSDANTYHAVVLTGYDDETGYYSYWDAQNQCSGKMKKADIAEIYNISSTYIPLKDPESGSGS